MARAVAMLCLAVAVLAIFTNCAEATKGKAYAPIISFGKGYKAEDPAPAYETKYKDECKDVCEDVCKKVPKESCVDTETPYDDCKDIVSNYNEKKCEKVCTKTVTYVEASYGKGKGYMMGKGRHLMTLGKGYAAPVVSCKDVCKDIPMTKTETKCETKSKKETKCTTVEEEKCEKKCDKVCTKVAYQVAVKAADPVVVAAPSYSKAYAMPMISKGYGKWGH